MSSRNATLTFRGEFQKAPRRFGPAYLARASIARRLGALEGGQLHVRDTWGEWQAGDGSAKAIELRILDAGVYLALAAGGSIGVARAFMDGRWECSDLTGLLRLFIRNMPVVDGVETGLAWFTNLAARVQHKLRANSHSGSRRNIREHYDLGNAFFALFLDETMTYSAGIFEQDSSTMRDASLAKLDRICRKLELGPADHLLEIGTGWGGMAIYAARHTGCRVTTTTISREQYVLARERVAAAGLEDRVTVLLEDYRDLTGRYDKLVSLEMIEAIGHRYFDTYFAQCGRLLKDDGLMLLQAITIADQRYEAARHSVDFIQRHIFPGSTIPSVTAMIGAITRRSDMKLVDLEDIGPHYATTLRRWRENFFARIGEVRALGYPETFVRMWEFYLCYCEGGFEERAIGDVQMLLAKPGNRRGVP